MGEKDDGPGRKGIRIAMLSIHGLIRGKDLELGRDPDTGGQTRYVVELARALGRRREIARVDLLTRLVIDPAVDPSYQKPIESSRPRPASCASNAGPKNTFARKSSGITSTASPTTHSASSAIKPDFPT